MLLIIFKYLKQPRFLLLIRISIFLNELKKIMFIINIEKKGILINIRVERTFKLNEP